jgi:hypothetical protein
MFYHQRRNPSGVRKIVENLVIWCTTPKHHHFQTTKIGHPDFLLFLIPLVEMLQLMRGLKLLEHLSKYAKLTELKNSP